MTNSSSRVLPGAPANSPADKNLGEPMTPLEMIGPRTSAGEVARNCPSRLVMDMRSPDMVYKRARMITRQVTKKREEPVHQDADILSGTEQQL